MREAIVAACGLIPQVQNEIQAIQQPAADFRDRCQAPVPDALLQANGEPLRAAGSGPFQAC